MAEFFKIIRTLRMMKGVKQSEIAQVLKVRQQSVSKLENGKTRISQEAAGKIARHLGFHDQTEMKTFYENNIGVKTHEKEIA